jgi:DNA-directed RNA polymerase specialized sigma24 family protein
MRMVRLAVLLVDDPGTAEDVVQEAFTGLAPALGRAARRGRRRRLPPHGRGQRFAVGAAPPAAPQRDYVPPHQVNARSAESLAMLSAEHQAVVDALSTLPPGSARCSCCATTAGCPRRRSRTRPDQPGHREVDRQQALDAVQRSMAGRPGRA